MNRLMNEEGSTLVEFAISASVSLMVLFGIIQSSLAFYTLSYVSDAARNAARFAIVRGTNSCTNDSSPDPNCNLNPSKFTSTTDAAKNPVKAYLGSMGYAGIDPANLSVNAKWLVAGVDANGNNTWTSTPTCLTTNTDAYGNDCNAVGNAVNVVVTYSFQLNVPFWKMTPLSIQSTSQMVISQ